MCDYCGCRDEPLIGELMDEHDRIMDLAWRIVRHPEVGSASGDAARAELRTLLQIHAAKEEAALYPLLMASGDLDVDDRDVFEEEHRELLALVDDADFDADSSTVLAEHIRAEELDLFPDTIDVFDDADWAEMARIHHEIHHAYQVPHDHHHPGGAVRSNRPNR